MLKFTSMRRCFAYAALLAIVPVAIAANDPAIQPSGRVSMGETEESPTPSSLVEGFTEPYADINMAASEMGTLAKVNIKDGDEVKVGQVLANLDDAVLRASLQVAKAGMSAEGELLTATTQLDLKKVELEKLTELFGRNHASQQELDRVRGEVRLAEARIQSVREDLDVRRLEHLRIQAQLSQREIRSTIDGVVVEVRKDRGEFVSPSDPVVARIVQLDPLLVVFSVPNDRCPDVNRGQSVNMQIGQSSTTATGVVEHVSPTADATSQTFRVKVRLPNPDRHWYGGEKSVLLIDGPRTFEPTKQLAKNAKK